MKKIIAGLFLVILLLLLGNGFLNSSALSFRTGSQSIYDTPDAESIQHLISNNPLHSFLSIQSAKAEMSPVGGAIGRVESQTDIGNLLDPEVSKDYANVSWVFDIWDFSLSLVNIALIGVLIFLGIVNILHLNYDTYQFKKILLPLIIFVILANLSLFICRGIIDFSDALTNTFANDKDSIVTGIKNGLYINGIKGGFATVGVIAVIGAIGSGTLWGALIVFLILALVIILILLLISAIMYVRVFIIFLLCAVSPLAFAFGVLPATQGLFKKWWDWFIRWVFMGPLILLVLKVASIIGGPEPKDQFAPFAFIAVGGLMVVAIMVPWLLAGSVMGKLQGMAMKTGGWAGKNVPGVSHATAFVGGRLEKFKADRDRSHGQFRAAGYGLGEGGWQGMKKGWQAGDTSANNKQFGDTLLRVGGAQGLGEMNVEELQKHQKNNSDFYRLAVKEMSDKGVLDSTFVKKIADASKGMKDPERKKLVQKIDFEIDQQRKNTRSGENPADVHNYLKDENTANIDSANRNIKTLERNTNPNVKQVQTKEAIEKLSMLSTNAQSDEDKNKINKLVNKLVSTVDEKEIPASVQDKYKKLKTDHHVDFSAMNKNLAPTNQVAEEHHTVINELLSSPIENQEFKENDKYHKAMNAIGTQDIGTVLTTAGISGEKHTLLKKNWDANKKKIEDAGFTIVAQTPPTAIPAAPPPPPAVTPPSRPVTSTLQTNRKISL